MLNKTDVTGGYLKNITESNKLNEQTSGSSVEL